MRHPHRSPAARLSALAAVALLSACSTNPVTGEREFSLISESQEVQMGREADQQVVASLGLYGGEELQQYVQDLGMRLARHSERPDLPWTFRVVDDPSINAFALPGGFVYVTRGIMTHLNSEAELVGILGHEIGHITARHAVSRISNAQLTQLGLGLGMIFVPELQAFGDLANVGMQLLFLRFSREDERQSDRLGFRYMVEAGYDPRELADVFGMLERASEASGRGQIPGWLATHPDPGDRREAIAGMVREASVDFSDLAVRRAEYMRRIDGMVYGTNPREGYFVENLFLHPDLEFRLRFPRGWNGINGKQAVQAISPQEDAIMVLSFAEESTLRGALRTFANQQGVRMGRTTDEPVNGHPALWGEFQVQTQQGTLQGVVTFVEYRGRIYRLLGYSSARRWGSYAQSVAASISSFDRESDPEVLRAQPKRIDVVDIDRSLALSTFLDRYPSTVDREEVARINQVPLGGELPAGLVKRVVGPDLPR